LRNSNPIEDNPFKTFDNNPGIIRLSIASLAARAIFIICFLLLATRKFKQNVKIIALYILTSVTIAFLQWFELYYGSTFYYGEIRDKQGMMFPFLGSLMITLGIWKINYSKLEQRTVIIKLILTCLINAGLYVLWTQVYDSWNLGQS
jgi:hypothetical protein